MNLPDSIEYCVIGGGVHGLSTAWHLAMELEASGRGSGRDVVVLEKRRSLEPFRLSRYSTGVLHPSSQSPFPWN